MKISKKRLKKMLEDAFYMGMNYGYGVDHTNKEEDEDRFCKEYISTIQEIK